jgi:hypothetical protein
MFLISKETFGIVTLYFFRRNISTRGTWPIYFSSEAVKGKKRNTSHETQKSNIHGIKKHQEISGSS